MARFNEDGFLRLVRGETAGLSADAARIGLGFCAVGYGLAVAAKNAAFDHGLRAAARASAPVVSVGNLTLGGTGKTPMVEWVARWYRRRGVRVAVLSRGYSRDESTARNDEAMVLEENLPDVPHLQDPDRVAIAGVAAFELESELLILDDGFQHRRLARDLDLVLIDALEPFGLGRLVPRGLLREPVGSLRRAGLVVLTRADLVSPDAIRGIQAAAERKAGALRWVVTRHAPIELIGEGVEPEAIAGLGSRRVAGFCGIGNPEGFLRTITPLCGALAGFRRFPDHHAYRGSDVADLARWVADLGADLALTTQKDLVKLRAAGLGDVPLRALRIGLDVMEGGSLLDDALASLLPATR